MHHVTRLAPATALCLALTACGGSEPSSQSVPTQPQATPEVDVRLTQSVAPSFSVSDEVSTETPRAAKSAAPAPKGSPTEAFQDFVSALRAGEISSVVELVTTRDERAEMKAAWDKQRKQPMSESEAAEFEQFIGMLTADGAEDMLFAMAQPQLAEAQQQLQMVAAMAPMLAAGAMQEVGAPEESMAVVNGIAMKLAALDIASEAKAKEAIGIVCSAARSLKMNTASDMVALEFDQLMGKVDIAYGAIVDVVDVYGFDVEAAMDSIRVESAKVDGDAAELTVTMELFGTEIDAFPVEMEKVEGRWMFLRPEAAQELATENGFAR